MSKAEQDIEGYRGTDQGGQLKVGDSSGFEGLLGGINSAGSYIERGLAGYFWSSTTSKVTIGGQTYIGLNAYARKLSAGSAKVGRYLQANGTAENLSSVRCLKD